MVNAAQRTRVKVEADSRPSVDTHPPGVQPSPGTGRHPAPQLYAVCSPGGTSLYPCFRLVTERRDLGLDDGSFWPVLEGIPATEMFKVIPQAPGHAYGMFMERFNELSELRKCA